MKLIEKIAAGLLLSWGFFCLLITVSALPTVLDKDVTTQNKTEATDSLVGGIAFGLPPLGLGSWLVWRLYQQRHKETRERLQSTFFRLIEQDNGRITVLRFAKETHLSGEQAKQFLDERAKEFNATFDTDERGGISYFFNL